MWQSRSCKHTACLSHVQQHRVRPPLGSVSYSFSESLPCVMTPVNSVSWRASISNQWVLSSELAHQAPPRMSSSSSEPWKPPRPRDVLLSQSSNFRKQKLDTLTGVSDYTFFEQFHCSQITSYSTLFVLHISFWLWDVNMRVVRRKAAV